MNLDILVAVNDGLYIPSCALEPLMAQRLKFVYANSQHSLSLSKPTCYCFFLSTLYTLPSYYFGIFIIPQSSVRHFAMSRKSHSLFCASELILQDMS